MSSEDIVYKKNSKKHYMITALVVVAVVAIGYFLFNFLSESANSDKIPSDYRFSLVEEVGGVPMTYYVYENQIWTEEAYSEDDKTVMIYDNIETEGLTLKDGDPENCVPESCKAYSKTLKKIKKLLQNKPSTQYF